MTTFTDTNENFFVSNYRYSDKAYSVQCTCGRHSVLPAEVWERHTKSPTSCPMCGTRRKGNMGKINFSQMKFDVTEVGDKQFRMTVHIRVYNPYKKKYAQNTKYEVGFNYLDKKYDIKVNGKDPRTENIAGYYKRVFSKVPLSEVIDKLEEGTESAFWRCIFGIFNTSATSFGVALHHLITENHSGIEIISTSRLSPILKRANVYDIYREYSKTDSFLRSRGSNLRQVLNMTKGQINSMVRTSEYILNSEGVHNTIKDSPIKILNAFIILSKTLPIQQVEDLIRMAVEEGHYDYILNNVRELMTFIRDYSYLHDPIRLIRYVLRDLKLEQGIMSPSEGIRLLRDYLRMSKDLGREPERYPTSLKKVHDITAMNYRVVSDAYKERNFQRRSAELEHWQHRGRRYSFLLPQKPRDLVDEGTSLHHCVASYVDDVIRQNCMIIFMRTNQELEKSHVTIEVRNRRIVQARGQSNRQCSQEEKDAIRAWANAKDLEYSH